MVRTSIVCLSLGLLVQASVFGAGQRPAGTGASSQQRLLAADLDAMNARVAGARPSNRQAMADSERLVADYQGLLPYAPGFGAADYALNGDLTRRSLDWLARAGALYASDPEVTRALLRAYEFIGDFHHRYGSFYRPGEYLAYAGANRLVRSMMLGSRNPGRFERDLERYSLAWATAAYVNGAMYGPRSDAAPAAPEPEIQQPSCPAAALPDVDERTLDADQKALWADVRERFMNVSPRVQEACMFLGQLSAKLQARNMRLNVTDEATALMMHGFLGDAVDLIRAGEFEKAKEALVRADYERGKLKSVTGQ
jgi:hypothetical protein